MIRFLFDWIQFNFLGVLPFFSIIVVDHVLHLFMSFFHWICLDLERMGIDVSFGQRRNRHSATSFCSIPIGGNYLYRLPSSQRFFPSACSFFPRLWLWLWHRAVRSLRYLFQRFAFARLIQSSLKSLLNCSSQIKIVFIGYLRVYLVCFPPSSILLIIMVETVRHSVLDWMRLLISQEKSFDRHQACSCLYDENTNIPTFSIHCFSIWLIRPDPSDTIRLITSH